jgi:hypothetical protein
MDYNGKQLTTVNIEQLRSLAETIDTARREAIADMKTAGRAMHEQGRLLLQAKDELGEAFEAFLVDLPNHGIAEDQARHSLRLARRYDTAEEMFADPSGNRQMVLTYAIQKPQQQEVASPTKPIKTPAFVLTFHMNRDPMDWTASEWEEFRVKSRPVANVWREAKERE